MLANYQPKESILSKKKNAQIIEIRILSFKQLTRSTWNSNLLDMAIFFYLPYLRSNASFLFKINSIALYLKKSAYFKSICLY